MPAVRMRGRYLLLCGVVRLQPQADDVNPLNAGPAYTEYIGEQIARQIGVAA